MRGKNKLCGGMSGRVEGSKGRRGKRNLTLHMHYVGDN